MDRKNRKALASALRKAYKVGVAPYQKPENHFARLHAWRSTVDAIVKCMADANANFDAEKFRADVGDVALSTKG